MGKRIDPEQYSPKEENVFSKERTTFGSESLKPKEQPFNGVEQNAEHSELGAEKLEAKKAQLEKITKAASTTSTAVSTTLTVGATAVIAVGGVMVLNDTREAPNIVQFSEVYAVQNTIQYSLLAFNEAEAIESDSPNNPVSSEDDQKIECFLTLVLLQGNDRVAERPIEWLGIHEGVFEDLAYSTEYTLNVYENLFFSWEDEPVATYTVTTGEKEPETASLIRGIRWHVTYDQTECKHEYSFQLDYRDDFNYWSNFMISLSDPDYQSADMMLEFSPEDPFTFPEELLPPPGRSWPLRIYADSEDPENSGRQVILYEEDFESAPEVEGIEIAPVYDENQSPTGAPEPIDLEAQVYFTDFAERWSSFTVNIQCANLTFEKEIAREGFDPDGHMAFVQMNMDPSLVSEDMTVRVTAMSSYRFDLVNERPAPVLVYLQTIAGETPSGSQINGLAWSVDYEDEEMFRHQYAVSFDYDDPNAYWSNFEFCIEDEEGDSVLYTEQMNSLSDQLQIGMLEADIGMPDMYAHVYADSTDPDNSGTRVLLYSEPFEIEPMVMSVDGHEILNGTADMDSSSSLESSNPRLFIYFYDPWERWSSFRVTLTVEGNSQTTAVQENQIDRMTDIAQITMQPPNLVIPSGSSYPPEEIDVVVTAVSSYEYDLVDGYPNPITIAHTGIVDDSPGPSYFSGIDWSVTYDDTLFRHFYTASFNYTDPNSYWSNFSFAIKTEGDDFTAAYEENIDITEPLDLGDLGIEERSMTYYAYVYADSTDPDNSGDQVVIYYEIFNVEPIVYSIDTSEKTNESPDSRNLYIYLSDPNEYWSDYVVTITYQGQDYTTNVPANAIDIENEVITVDDPYPTLDMAGSQLMTVSITALSSYTADLVNGEPSRILIYEETVE